MGVVGIGWSSALVPSNATAVTANITVANASTAGFVSFGPTMTAFPATSTLNVAAGVPAANGITVALNKGNLQAVWCAASGSTADVMFDITGYFTTDAASGGQSYHAVTPFRIMDSSIPRGVPGIFTTETPQSFNVGGVGAIPSNAVGISGNLTVINPSTAGFAFIGPAPVIRPPSSTLNTSIHVSMANGFDVKLSSSTNGRVSIVWDGYAGSQAHISLDVTGYWL